MIEIIEEERLTPAQRLHRRFNEAATRVRGLKTLIAIRQASGEDFSALWRTLEHAESVDMQERSVALFSALAAGVPETDHGSFAGFLDYAVAHRDVVRRFGRFPHRNRILGRESTAAEIEFLKQPGSSF